MDKVGFIGLGRMGAACFLDEAPLRGLFEQAVVPLVSATCGGRWHGHR
jgi:hypothetical protein